MRDKRRKTAGQATVEFALCVTVFLMIVFGTVDFGRAIFMKAELDNAVREGARFGKVHPSDASGVQSAVTSHAPGGVVVSAPSCSPSPCATGSTMTVTASIQFSAVTQSLLGINPFTMTSTATVDVE